MNILHPHSIGTFRCNCTFQNVMLCYVMLTVHLGSVLVNSQLDTQFFFRIYLFQFCKCFEHPSALRQENQLY